ncbi:hypothetical protein Pelo_17176 [Pelomyxa schiedti]|nr:hypothetical protein Pelo_17176 [Pelomyxa schiedti]
MQKETAPRGKISLQNLAHRNSGCDRRGRTPCAFGINHPGEKDSPILHMILAHAIETGSARPISAWTRRLSEAEHLGII